MGKRQGGLPLLTTTVMHSNGELTHNDLVDVKLQFGRYQWRATLKSRQDAVKITTKNLQRLHLCALEYVEKDAALFAKFAFAKAGCNLEPCVYAASIVAS